MLKKQQSEETSKGLKYLLKNNWGMNKEEAEH